MGESYFFTTEDAEATREALSLGMDPNEPRRVREQVPVSVYRINKRATGRPQDGVDAERLEALGEHPK